MNLKQSLTLIFLALIWGSSFIFMKILAPKLGAILTADLRILLGGGFLLLFLMLKKQYPLWSKNIKQYLVIGILNCALPFAFFCYAALWIPASYSVILNATAPMFGVLYAALWLEEKLTLPRIISVLVGSSGVFIMCWKGPVPLNFFSVLGMSFCIMASACYGLSGVYIKIKASHLSPSMLAACGQLMGGLLLFPLSFSGDLPPIDAKIIICVLALAILCSSLAFALYFNLVKEVGPSKSLTVTFLTPITGAIWSKIFLNESITFIMILGAMLIIGGTFGILRLR